MQTLTMKNVLVSVNKAIKNRKLGAARGHTECLYNYPDGCGCAIGVSLYEDTLNSIRAKACNGQYLQTVVGQGILSVKSETERLDMRTLQNAHDAWALHNPHKSGEDAEFGRTKSAAEKFRKEFFKVLNNMRTKYNVKAKQYSL